MKAYIPVIALLLAILLVGCGKKNETYEPTAPSTAAPTTETAGSGLTENLFDNQETTQPTVAAPTTPVATTQPVETTAPTTPTETSKPSEPPVTQPPSGEMTYEVFQAMTPAQQQSYMETFAKVEDFFTWYNQAKEKYEKENPSIEIGDGTIDLENLPKN